jgi:DNA modification methylase
MATSPARRRKATATSGFGVGRRENHDATAFYDRFTPPNISSDDHVNVSPVVDQIITGDARTMDALPDASVALVVTSPPYFANKLYEQEVGKGGIPATYVEYLKLLRDVFAECVRVLEPGGRICVNVANLGRRPYRSLSADVIGILQDDLGLLLRGEVIWIKAAGAAGSCAWGSYLSASNPVLRDVSERIIIASKGRFNRAQSENKKQRRKAAGLPWEDDLTTEQFTDYTLDVWQFRPESARRVGHPAPFPVELPERCIRLFTFKGDLVLDPFAGSGTAAIAAKRAGRHYVGYELDPAYAEAARRRVEVTE